MRDGWKLRWRSGFVPSCVGQIGSRFRWSFHSLDGSLGSGLQLAILIYGKCTLLFGATCLEAASGNKLCRPGWIKPYISSCCIQKKPHSWVYWTPEEPNRESGQCWGGDSNLK